jgi:hypothetical protein
MLFTIQALTPCLPDRHWRISDHAQSMIPAMAFPEERSLFMWSMHLCHCVVFVVVFFGARGADSADAGKPRERSDMTTLFSAKLAGQRSVELHTRDLPLEIGAGEKRSTIAGTFLWLQVKDERSSKKRAVWREWIVTRTAKEWHPHDFHISEKNADEIAFAFVEGPNIRFWEVKLNGNVDVDAKAAAHYASNTARPAPIYNTPTNIPVLRLLKHARVEVASLRIEDITWKDGGWHLQASVGNLRINLVRPATELQWKVRSGNH